VTCARRAEDRSGDGQRGAANLRVAAQEYGAACGALYDAYAKGDAVFLPFVETALNAVTLYLSAIVSCSDSQASQYLPDGLRDRRIAPIAADIVERLEREFADWPGNQGHTFRQCFAPYEHLLDGSLPVDQIASADCSVDPLIDLVMFLEQLSRNMTPPTGHRARIRVAG
jgi:hypothetical protein